MRVWLVRMARKQRSSIGRLFHPSFGIFEIASNSFVVSITLDISSNWTFRSYFSPCSIPICFKSTPCSTALLHSPTNASNTLFWKRKSSLVTSEPYFILLFTIRYKINQYKNHRKWFAFLFIYFLTCICWLNVRLEVVFWTGFNWNNC